MEQGRVALVTGASRGIGRAIALSLARDGYDIVVNYRQSADAANALCGELEAMGVQALAVRADVSAFEESKALVDSALGRFARLDVLVNNAGVTRDGLVMRMGEAQFDEVISVNLKSAFNCIRHASPVMVKQRSGCIINIASVAGVMGNAGQANYSAAKAGLIGMTKSVARELASRNITVNAIAPGFIQTDMTKTLSAEATERLKALIPLARFGEPEDVAGVAAFLASGAGRYITGQVIVADGGMCM